MTEEECQRKFNMSKAELKEERKCVLGCSMVLIPLAGLGISALANDVNDVFIAIGGIILMVAMVVLLAPRDY